MEKTYSWEKQAHNNKNFEIKRFSEPNFKLSCSKTSKVNQSFEPRNVSKTIKTISVVGC